MDAKVVNNKQKSLAIYMFEYNQEIEKQNKLISRKLELEKKGLDPKATDKQRAQMEKERKYIKEEVEESILNQGKILNEMMVALPDDIEINGEKYPLVLNTNTFVNLEDYYTSSDEFLDQCQNKVPSAIFNGAYYMIIEGIEIYNQEQETYNKYKRLYEKTQEDMYKKEMEASEKRITQLKGVPGKKREQLDKTILGKQSLTSLFKVVFKKILEIRGEEGLMLVE